MREAELYFRQPVEIGAQDPALQDKVCELAFAKDLDQAGGLELLDVMGQGRGADALALMHDAARRRGGVLADLLEDLNTTGLGERARDARDLALGQGRDAGGGHRRKISSIRNDFQHVPAPSRQARGAPAPARRSAAATSGRDRLDELGEYEAVLRAVALEVPRP